MKGLIEMLRYVRTFLPWIAFAVLSTRDDVRWGALVALALAVFFVVTDRRKGLGWDSLVIEVSSLVYFAGLAIASLTISHAPLGGYSAAWSAAWLGLTTWASLAIRQPFTIGIARLSTPREVWETPLFYKINAVITAAWGIAFTLQAIALFALAPATAGIIVIQIAALVAPALFTARYPDIAVKRALA